jgi:hypothetical protein
MFTESLITARCHPVIHSENRKSGCPLVVCMAYALTDCRSVSLLLVIYYQNWEIVSKCDLCVW